MNLANRNLLVRADDHISMTIRFIIDKVSNKMLGSDMNLVSSLSSMLVSR